MGISLKEFKNLRFRLPVKLLLLSLIGFLPVIFASYFYVQKLENFLIEHQQALMIQEGEAIAAALSGKDFLFYFPENIADILENNKFRFDWNKQKQSNPPYLPFKVKIDGNLNEWKGETFFYQQKKTFSNQHLLTNQRKYKPSDLSFDYLLAQDDSHYYIMLEIFDNNIVLYNKDEGRLNQSDHVQINFLNNDKNINKYLISISEKNQATAYLMDKNKAKKVNYISAKWKENLSGYQVEVKINKKFVTDKLVVAVADIDDIIERTVNNLIATKGIRKIKELGIISIEAPEINQLLFEFNEKNNNENIRFWVVDNFCNVRAYDGSLVTENKIDLDNLLLLDACNKFPKIAEALKTNTNSMFTYFSKRINIDVMNVTIPISNSSKQDVLGAVVVEKTLKDVFYKRDIVFEDFLNGLVLAFIFSFFILLAFSLRLTTRIRSLAIETIKSVDNEGLVKNENITGAIWKDELGDLAKNIARKLKDISSYIKKLTDYNLYLKQYKDKLGHEIQTPISVVSTSLELLEMEDISKEAKVYLDRANKGLKRLELIVYILSHTRNIEDAVQAEPKETINISKELKEYIESYKIMHPDKILQLELPKGDYFIRGSSWLVEQMLDKILDNAVDFSQKDSPINIILEPHEYSINISITNQGPKLTEHMKEQLFDYLISVRDASNKTPHLGLGLYIAKLIAEFHHGHISAKNLKSGSGVIVTITIGRLKI